MAKPISKLVTELRYILMRMNTLTKKITYHKTKVEEAKKELQKLEEKYQDIATQSGIETVIEMRPR